MTRVIVSAASSKSLTLSRFCRTDDPHQVQGHLPLWRPSLARVLAHLAARAS